MSGNPTFKPSESKREEFRTYLEKNGVTDALTKLLVNLYEEPEKPEDALAYVRDKLAMQAGVETFGQMKERIEELENKCESLAKELEDIKTAKEASEDAEMPAEEAPAPNDEQPEEVPTEEQPPAPAPEP